MSFHSWLRNLRSALAPSRGQRTYGSQGTKRPVPHRLRVEALEDRLTPSFSPATSFPVGGSPQAVVTGDFNGDGHLDLATANPDADTVSVLLGDGAGGFGDAIDTAVILYGVDVGVDSVFLTAADFNNDGKDDLAAGSRVLLSNGDGTFAHSGASPNNWWPVAAGDFNNDGNIDLVSSGVWYRSYYEVAGGSVTVLPGDGHGGFGQPLTSGYPDEDAEPGLLTVGDLNGDGNLDVVTHRGETGYNGGVFLGNGNGGFTGSILYTYTPAAAVALGDFTADGIPDLIYTGGGALFCHAGLGDGTFASFPTFASFFDDSTNMSDLAVGDFDGDGWLNPVTSDVYQGTVHELWGSGGTAVYGVGSSPSEIVVGDFNGDGRPDVATANAGSNTVSVLLNNGTWTPPPPPPPPPPRLRIGDVTVTEGNTGTASATFTVTLAAASTQTITVAYATGNGTATADNDYQSASGTLTFAPGETTKTISILVNGDRLAEPSEKFVVNLSGATNATIADGQGTGTIVDDEPRISISGVNKAEGKKGQTTLLTFTVTLSAAYDQPVSMSFATANGTAKTSDGDYIAKTGTLTFAPGQTTKTITIEVKGDSKWESNETFYLDLFGNSSNSLFTKNRGIGTILNDD